MLICIDSDHDSVEEAREFGHKLYDRLPKTRNPPYFCDHRCPWGAALPLQFVNNNRLIDFPENSFHLRQLRRQMQYRLAQQKANENPKAKVLVEGGLFAVDREWQTTVDEIRNEPDFRNRYKGFIACRPHACNPYWQFLTLGQQFDLTLFCTKQEQSLVPLATGFGLQPSQLLVVCLQSNLRQEIERVVSAINAPTARKQKRA